MPTPEITDADFVNSFLSAARQRKLSVIAIYGVNEAGRANLKLVSNVGEDATKGVLLWLRNQSPTVEQAPETEEVTH